jgi:hypothetical protein
MTPPSLAPPPGDTELDQAAPAELVSESRSVLPAPSRRTLPTRFAGPPLWLSAGGHLLLLAALLLYVRFGPESSPLGRPAPQQVIEYVDLVATAEIAQEAPTAEPPVAGEPPAVEPASPGARPAAPAGAVLVPGGVPSVISSEGGAAPPMGATSGGGGAAERLRPGFSDPRLYADPEIARMRQPGKSDLQRYREHFQARIDALNDSMYGATGPNTDWTVKDGSGNRWGVSEEGVHLGPLTIPRFLIPTPPPSGTNQDLEEARERQRQRDEIQRQEADREVRRARQESQDAARERREQQRSGEPDPGS